MDRPNSPTTEEEPYMTVDDVLRILRKVSRRTFYHWCAIGRGPARTKLPNGELRIHPDDFKAWMAELRGSAA